jgi:hypothetical protein
MLVFLRIEMCRAAANAPPADAREDQNAHQRKQDDRSELPSDYEIRSRKPALPSSRGLGLTALQRSDGLIGRLNIPENRVERP